MSFNRLPGFWGPCLASLLALREAPAQPIDLTPYKLTAYYSNEFNSRQKIIPERSLIEDGRRARRPPADAEWVSEGDGTAEIRGGRLQVTPRNSHMVVWNRNVFPADFLLDFQMRPNGSSSGLTIVFFCAAGVHGEDLFDLALPPRRGNYPAYHSGAIANYSDSYWSRNTVEESLTNRMRRNPGFHLVAEAPSGTSGSSDVTHRIRILKAGAHIEVEMDGKVLFRWDDPGKPLGAGRIGFRTMQGVKTISYGGLKVWKISPTPRNR